MCHRLDKWGKACVCYVTTGANKEAAVLISGILA